MALAGKTVVSEESVAPTHARLAPPEALDTFYIIRDRSAVAAFLENYRHLSPLLLDVAAHIKAFFGDAPLYLDVENEPEDGSQQLVVTVSRTTLTYREMRTRMRQFDNDWWRDASQRVLGLVTVLPEIE